MPQTILLFGGSDSLRCDQEKTFKKKVERIGYVCQTFSACSHSKEQKSINRIICDNWDFFIAGRIDHHIEEAKQVINLLLAVPGNAISAVMIRSSSGNKSYDAYAKEFWRYLQMECPSIGVFNVPGSSTPEEIHEKIMQCINIGNKLNSADRFPYHRHN